MLRKTYPQGVDLLIDKLQVHLNTKLSNTLGAWENNHRAYKNPKRKNENGLVAEVYVSDGEYRDCFYDDNYDSTSFFLSDDESGFVENRSSRRLSWILQVNFRNIYSTVHRPDEELRNDIVSAFKTFKGLIELDSVVTGIDRVYEEFDKTLIKYDDMSDVHVLRINFTGQYDTTCCLNC